MAEINHHLARRFIQTLDGLDQPKRQLLEQHLSACPACRVYAEQYPPQIQQVEQYLRQALHARLDPVPIPRPVPGRIISTKMKAHAMNKNLLSIAGLLAVVALAVGLFTFAPRILPQQSDKEVNIRFVYLAGSADYQSLASAFHQQHPNITIDLVAIPQLEDMYTRFQTEIANADVFRAPVRWLGDDQVQHLLPLDHLLAIDKQFPHSDLFPGSLKPLQANGKQMGIPAGLETAAIFYNPKKFEDAGIQPPGPDWTLDEFLQAAVSINNQKDARRFTYGFCSNPNAGDDFAFFSYLFDGGMFYSNARPTRPTLNRRENVNALIWYTSLKTDYGILPDVSNSYQMTSRIAGQYCGFWMDTASRVNFGGETVYGLVSDPFPVKMLPLPAHIGQYPGAAVEDYSILASSQNAPAAWEWIKYLVGQPAAAGKLIPPLKTQVFSKDNPYGLSTDLLAVASRLPENPILYPLDGMLRGNQQAVNQTAEIFHQAVVQVFNGEAGAQAALDLAQAKAEQVFQK